MSNSKASALIGYTGFVGSNLLKKHEFTNTFNSKNINDAHGQSFELLVSAAPSAVKWKANKFPEEDLALVEDYINHLQQIEADFCVAISTCDVYEVPQGVDESTSIEPTLERLHPYGKHRFMLEDFVRKHFENHLIVRLPALFGSGLKKNVIYDFMHDNMLEAIDSRGVFQFYNLKYLWQDINKARELGLSLLNIATEPVSVAEIAQECFGKEFSNEPSESNSASYDQRSQYAKEWGGTSGYMYKKEQVLEDIKSFVLEETQKDI